MNQKESDFLVSNAPPPNRRHLTRCGRGGGAPAAGRPGTSVCRRRSASPSWIMPLTQSQTLVAYLDTKSGVFISLTVQ